MWWSFDTKFFHFLAQVSTLKMEKSFDPIEFVGNLSVEELKTSKVTKDQLKYIATGFEIPFQRDARKDDLMALILTHLGEEPSPSRGLEVESQTKDPSLLLEIEG